MRELAVINSNHPGLKIFDRMRGVWIKPQPLLEKKPERKQSPHDDSIYAKSWNDFINKHFQG